MPRHDDIIARPKVRVFCFRGERCLQPAADAVPRHRISNFLCDCKAKARPRRNASAAATGRGSGSFTHLDQKRRRRLPPAAAYSEKFGTRPERWQNRNGSLQSRKKAAGSGAEALDLIRPKDACGPSRDDVPELSDHRPSTCVCEIRGDACEQGGSVDMCASRKSPSKSLKARDPKPDRAAYCCYFSVTYKYSSPGRRPQPIAHFSGIRVLIVGVERQVNAKDGVRRRRKQATNRFP
jgi:hypothetical protein